jgi:kinesin family protein C1
LQLNLDKTNGVVRSNEETIAELRTMLAQREATIAENEKAIRDHETMRRKLHNTIQELKVWHCAVYTFTALTLT